MSQLLSMRDIIHRKDHPYVSSRKLPILPLLRRSTFGRWLHQVGVGVALLRKFHFLFDSQLHIIRGRGYIYILILFGWQIRHFLHNSLIFLPPLLFKITPNKNQKKEYVGRKKPHRYPKPSLISYPIRFLYLNTQGHWDIGRCLLYNLPTKCS